MGKKVCYEVRVREKIGETWVKKSKFYFAHSPNTAAQCYKGSGNIFSVMKASKEQLLGVGEFFRLGDSLLQELRMNGKEVVSPIVTKDQRRRVYLTRIRKIKEGVNVT